MPPTQYQTTLTQFLIEERRRYPGASGDFNSLILGVALACKRIARAAAFGGLDGMLGHTSGTVNLRGEAKKTLDVLSNDAFLRVSDWGSHLAGLASGEMAEPFDIPARFPKGKYLLVFDPLDGSSNIDVNVCVGSIFSVLRSHDGDQPVSVDDYLQPGVQQVAAGYALYGPSTMLVMTVGNGVHGFTLDPSLGEFILTHADLTVPAHTTEFAINASNRRFWEAPVKQYVNECLAGRTGPRSKDFNLRWIASIVGEAHRILMRGGVCMYPPDSRAADLPERLRLLYQANPIAFIMEQAGGAASTGRQRVMAVAPQSLHQRIPLIFGSRDEVERIERYHNMPQTIDLPNPLFNERSLFRLPG
jgi:fructose-1,6-bisphosphatase I/sedoheptulose-1,7-bisphosphatase